MHDLIVFFEEKLKIFIILRFYLKIYYVNEKVAIVLNMSSINTISSQYYSLNLGTIEIKQSRQSFYRVKFFI